MKRTIQWLSPSCYGGLIAGLLLAVLTPLYAEISSAAGNERIVRVGVYDNAPKVFISDSGNPDGIFIDIIEHIATREGWTLRYVPGTWGEGLDRLVQGEIELMPDVASSPEREQVFSFHKEPVLSDWFQVYARQGTNIRSIVDLDGKRITVLEHSIQQESFGHLAESFGLKITLIPMPDYQQVFEVVVQGDADAAIVNRFYGMWHAQELELEDTAVIFHPTELFFAAPGTASDELLQAIDRQLLQLKSDSQSIYYRSLKRWTGEETSFQFPAWLKTLGLVAGVILFVSLLGMVVLKAQVNARTKDLRRSEKQYRDIFNNAVMGIYQSTPEGTYQSVNPAMARMFGYETPEALMDDITDVWSQVYVHPEERTKVEHLFCSLGKKYGLKRCVPAAVGVH